MSPIFLNINRFMSWSNVVSSEHKVATQVCSNKLVDKGDIISFVYFIDRLSMDWHKKNAYVGRLYKHVTNMFFF